MRSAMAIAVMMLLSGCPEPPATNQGQAPSNANQPPGAQPAAPAGKPGQSDHAAGENPSMPAPDGSMAMAIADNGGRLNPTGFQVSAGDGVTMSGSISYDGTASGVLRLDFLKQPEGQTLPQLLHTMALDAPGPWKVDVPKDLGSVNIVAYLDANENGPNEGEPSATATNIEVGGDPITGIDLELTIKKKDKERDKTTLDKVGVEKSANKPPPEEQKDFPPGLTPPEDQPTAPQEQGSPGAAEPAAQDQGASQAAEPAAQDQGSPEAANPGQQDPEKGE